MLWDICLLNSVPEEVYQGGKANHPGSHVSFVVIFVGVVCDGATFFFANDGRDLIGAVSVRPLPTRLQGGYEVCVCSFVEVDVRGWVQRTSGRSYRRGGVGSVLLRGDRGFVSNCPVFLYGRIAKRS